MGRGLGSSFVSYEGGFARFMCISLGYHNPVQSLFKSFLFDQMAGSHLLLEQKNNEIQFEIFFI